MWKFHINQNLEEFSNSRFITSTYKLYKKNLKVLPILMYLQTSFHVLQGFVTLVKNYTSSIFFIKESMVCGEQKLYTKSYI